MGSDLPSEESPNRNLEEVSSEPGQRGLPLDSSLRLPGRQSGVDGEQAEAKPEQEHPVFKRALEILRQERPKIQSPESEVHSPGPAQESEGRASAASKAAVHSEPIPARMLNEFVYCRRLFYYEFVEGVFVESADTLRGEAIHERVDSGSGALPAPKAKVRRPKSKPTESGAGDAIAPSSIIHHPSSLQNSESGAGDPTIAPVPDQKAETENEVIHSRSVQMGSERLGVIAKMDLIESRVQSPEGEVQSSKNLAVANKVQSGDPESGQQTEFTESLFAPVEVCPVDYKAGAPKEGLEANELWDTDKMQLGLQTLILRDNGYTCTEGVIYYRATKQRVHLAMTPELESWILQNIAEARLVITGPLPPPLVNSPKCVRCSLAPVCLPDETRMLDRASVECEPQTDAPALQRSDAPTGPRRLITPRDDTRPLYLNTQGFRVGCKEEVLQIKEKDRVVEEVRLRDLSHVALFGNVQISTQAIQSMCEQEVPVTYFSVGGWFYGITRGHGLKNVFLRMEQFRLARDEKMCLSLARQFVHGKIRNHRTLLMRNHLEPPEPTILRLKRACEDALEAESIEELLGIEGAAASQYFQQFSGMIKIEDDLAPPSERSSRNDPNQLAFNFNFANRNRRPPTDPVNAMLSLAYSLLSKDCTLAALAVGFDPYIGFFHQPRFGRPALGLDLMEEFRPLVAESTVLSCINNRVVTEKDFVRAGQAVNLSAPGRKRFFQMYEQRMSSLITHPLFDYKVSYRRALELQARLLAKALTGEIAEYVPLLTR